MRTLNILLLIIGISIFPCVHASNEISNNFTIAEQGFQQRWLAFASNKKFADFAQNFEEKDIMQQYNALHQARMQLYYLDPAKEDVLQYNKGFSRAQPLLQHGFYKQPKFTAFEYNYSATNYNSSNVTLDGYRFLALEGPQKSAHVNNFLELLVKYDVKHVVRLTQESDHGKFKCEKYWDTTVKTNADGQALLFAKNIAIKYYFTEDWVDHAGIESQNLLHIIESVRKNYQPGEIVAVHCSAGMGRTGTFIAGFLLLEDIDKQLQAGVPKENIKISIEEKVYKLSVQRICMVSEASQYLSLHHLVNVYLALPN